jgi:hypothetical protein
LSEENVKLDHVLKKEYKIDELQRKEVIDNFTGHQVRLIEGEVLITKNPCRHEGNVRPAKAIDKDHPAY